MPTTTNFGWTTPADTDLVKDGALAIRTLGNGIDTSMVDLKGGTTGQVLSKASNTDMDFTWIANDQGDITGVTAGTGISGGGTSGTVTITNSMATEIAAAGDIIVGTGSGTFDNLPIGTTGQILTADTTVSPYKVKWAAAPGGGKVLQVVNATYSTLTTVTSTSFTDTGLTASITPTSASSKILVIATLPIYILQGSPATDAYGAWQIVRGSTAINGMKLIGNTGSAASPVIDLTTHWYDDPATTSSTTYKVQIAAFSSGVSIQAQYKYTSFGNSVITLMEIGA
jgi:hypothetical protein